MRTTRVIAMSLVRRLVCKATGCVKWCLRNTKEFFWLERVTIFEIEVQEQRFMTADDGRPPLWKRASPVDMGRLLADPELSKSLGPSFKARFDGGQFQLYIAEDDDSGYLIGYASFSTLRKHITRSLEFVTSDGECFIGPYYVKSVFRGRGYASEAIRSLLQIAFESGMTRAYVDVGARNFASQQVVKKAGGSARKSGYLRIRFIGRDYAVPFGQLKRKFKTVGSTSLCSVEG